MRIQDKIITDREFYQKVMRIFIPVILQSCINQGVNMMDTIMVGSLGDVAISASSLANQFYSFFNCLCMGVSGAGLILTSQCWGASRKSAVLRIFDLLLQLTVIFGILFAVVSAAVPEKIMALYCDDTDVIREGTIYLRITSLVYIPHGISMVMANVMRSVGNARLGLYTSIFSFFVNIAGNYVLIFGKFGFPEMGLAGAAVGTLCARVAELIVCAVFVLKIDKILLYRPAGMLKLPRKNLVYEFFRLGIPVIIGDFLLALSANAVSMILGHMGKEFVSSYAIVQVIERMCTIASGGAASAAGIMTGHAIGAKQYEKAQSAGFTFLLVGCGIGLVGSLLILVLGEWSISLYAVGEKTVEIASSMMIANSIIVIFQIIQSVMGKGVLRGGGDSKFVMITDVVFQWCASIPLGYLVGIYFHMSPFIVLLAVRLDYIIKAIIYMFRLRSGKWIKETNIAREPS